MTLSYFFLPVLFASTVALTAQSTPSFELKRDTTPTSGSQFSVQGDFNNDGKPDLVTGLTLRLGKGDGTFGSPMTVGSTNGGVIGDVAVADLNGDGKLDLIVSAGYIDVFFGNGDGTFKPAVMIITNSYPTSLAVADFNGDGIPDIAAGDTNGNIEIFKNVGAGYTFLPAAIIHLEGPAPVTALRAGDVDANGTMDLAATINNSAYVLWGDGRGGFTPVLLRTYSPGYGGIGLGVGDLNQDGNSDIILSYSCGTPYSVGRNPGSLCTVIDVFYGQGNRNVFYRPAVIDSGVNVFGLTAVDINGDGIGDLVGGGSDLNSQQGLFAYLGHPDGSFDQTPQRYIAASEGASPIVAGDWNRDGKMDFAQSLVSDGTTEVYLNASSPTPCATSQISPTVTVCNPVEGTYLVSPVRIQATTDDKTPITALQEYIDYKLLYSENVKTFNIMETLAPGSHLLVTKAFDANGVSFRSNRRITVYSGTPGSTCAATLGSASICLPGGDTSVAPVHIVANGYTSVVPTAAQLYIDSNLVINDRGCEPSYCPGGSSSIDTYQNLPTGTHNLFFKLYDANGAVYTAQKNVTVK